MQNVSSGQRVWDCCIRKKLAASFCEQPTLRGGGEKVWPHNLVNFSLCRQRRALISLIPGSDLKDSCFIG